MDLSTSTRQHVVNLRNGDESSFTQLYNAYEGKLHHYAMSLVKSPEFADDVVQEVFTRIWDQRQSIDPEKSFLAFIFTISRNHIINLMKRSAIDVSIRNEILFHAEKGINYTEESFHLKETELLIKEALKSLPAQQKRIFELCKINGLSYEEAAAELNIKAGTVNAQIVKSLKAVRKYLNLHGALNHQFILFLMASMDIISILSTNKL